MALLRGFTYYASILFAVMISLNMDSLSLDVSGCCDMVLECKRLDGMAGYDERAAMLYAVVAFDADLATARSIE